MTARVPRWGPKRQHSFCQVLSLWLLLLGKVSHNTRAAMKRHTQTMGLNHLQKQLPQPSQACITWEQPHERPQAFGTTQLSCWFTAPQKLRDNESLLCWATIFGGSLLSINRYRMHLLCTQQPCDTHCKMMLIVTQRLSNFSLSWGENQWKNAGLTCVTPWIPHLTPQRKRIVISPD